MDRLLNTPVGDFPISMLKYAVKGTMVFGSSQGRGCCFCCVVGPNFQKPVWGGCCRSKQEYNRLKGNERPLFHLLSLLKAKKQTTAEQKDDNSKKDRAFCLIVS